MHTDSIFSEPILAREDLWILGDAFFRSIFATLQNMKSAADSFNKKNIPYIYNKYNILPFSKSTLVSPHNMLIRVGKALEEAFSQKWHLPKYILVLLDEDVLKMINMEEQGLTKQIDRCVNWIARQIDTAIEDRTNKLKNTKPGALYEQPTIIWVEMLERAYIAYSFPMKNRNKFNKVLNDIALKQANARVIAVEDNLEFHHFNSHGSLTYQGECRYWRHIDSLIQAFEDGRESLDPRHYIPTSTLFKPDPLPFGARCHHPNLTQQQHPFFENERNREDRRRERQRRDREREYEGPNRRRQCNPPSRRSLFDDFQYFDKRNMR